MKKKVILGLVIVLLLCASLFIFSRRAAAPADENTPENMTQTNATPTLNPQIAGLNKSRYSTTDPTSLWVIVNKVSALPSAYAPTDLNPVGSGEQLRAEAATALGKLLAAAKQNGSPMSPVSGYRSYATQTSTYNNYVKADGQPKADTYSARPGHSEHQSGWAVDVGTGSCDLQICFGDSAAGKWLVAHAHEYGFIIRYPNGKETITGYQYEPWHLRYVGVDLANELQKTGQTMEEFFNVVPTKQPY